MRYFLLIFSMVYLFGCKKSDPGSSDNPGGDGCVVPESISNNGDTVAGQYIVIYTPEQVANMNGRQPSVVAERVLQKYRIKTSSLVKSFDGQHGGFVAKLAPGEVAQLKADAAVKMIEQDRVIALGDCFTVVAPWLVTWNIEQVGYGDGTGKVAWVIDTGIDTDHPDLTVDKTLSKSFLNGVTSFTDSNGHGTHVAGIIGGKNNTFGVLGVAAGATLVSLRVLNKDGEGLLSGIVQALNYVNKNAKAGDAVNMSIGEEGVSQILDDQVKAIAAKGIFFSIAAGNDGKKADESSPARVNGTNIYTVAAVDSTGNFADFSNYGADVVDYAAPGVKILSTYTKNRYATMSGTSMAAPHVTGLLLITNGKLTSSAKSLADPAGAIYDIPHK